MRIVEKQITESEVVFESVNARMEIDDATAGSPELVRPINMSDIPAISEGLEREAYWLHERNDILRREYKAMSIMSLGVLPALAGTAFGIAATEMIKQETAPRALAVGIFAVASSAWLTTKSLLKTEFSDRFAALQSEETRHREKVIELALAAKSAVV